MVTPTAPKRFALLVGVDFYQNDNTRRLPVPLGHLQGAVNDVKVIHDLLHKRFRFDSTCTLTSTASPNDPSVPMELEQDWPTHANIKGAFEEICNKTNSGDIFFFQFSGHGASLQATSHSPKDGRTDDLSLMTTDYCCGKPAVRGWELNEWLWQFYNKGVRVIVLLDSCYSGGAWRGSRIRAPSDWTPPPNLPADEDAVQGIQKKPGHRDGDLSICWDLNPKDFTLMTACQNTEKASEWKEDTTVYGAFTLAIMKYFNNPSALLNTTYHAIYNHTTEQMRLWELPQRPQIFGQDRLAFLEDYEPISATPIFGTQKDDIVSLPVGKVHGINVGSEFITVSPSPRVIVSVCEIHDLESKAEVVGLVQDPPQSGWFIPYRWSSRGALNITIDRDLSDSFQRKLLRHVKARIAGEINIKSTEQFKTTQIKVSKRKWLMHRLPYLKKITRPSENRITSDTQYTKEVESTKNNDSQATWFRLGAKEGGGVDIFGPEHILGDQGPLRGWKNKGTTDDEKAAESAIALAHLFRFGQILHLWNESEDLPPFKIDVDSKANEDAKTTVDFLFQNAGDKGLSFAIFILSPGFHVKQLFPPTGTLQEVIAYGEKSVSFSLTVPDKLRSSEANGEKRQYRDIVRTIVTTKGRNFSLKSMELPDIWNADQWDSQKNNDLGRDGHLKENQFRWWIRDVSMLIS